MAEHDWSGAPERAGDPRWTLLTNHGHALTYTARHPDARIRDIAAAIGITERSAHRIVSELVEAGYISRTRKGRRNHYTVDPEASLRHPLWRQLSVGQAFAALLAPITALDEHS
jgi:DNA-binding IclR family transcriptional regulator